MALRAYARTVSFEAALPWLIAVAGFAFDVAAFWPGQMSFDSAYAWWQARGGETTNIAPPMLIFLWRACDALLEGPGLVFALHLALFWSGLALLIGAFRAGAARMLAIVVVAAFAPVPWLLRAHVWTDVALFSSLLFVAGALARARTTHARAWIVVALPVLFYASAIRYNALPAALPFAAWAAWLALAPSASYTRVVAATVVLGASMFAFAAIVSSQVERRVPLWPAAAEWDLAAISVATGEMRLPGFMIGPGLDVAELSAAFRDWSIVPMLQGTQHGMRDPFSGDFTPAQLAELRDAWIAAIVAHPRAWLAHHARQAEALLGVHDAAWPRELIFVDDEFRYRDNPPVARNGSALHKALMRGAATLSRTWLLAGWPYLALGVIACPFAWRRRDDPAGTCALILLASAWLYVLPLIVLVPAELRYLGWSALASLLAAALAAFAPTAPRPGLINSTLEPVRIPR